MDMKRFSLLILSAFILCVSCTKEERGSNCFSVGPEKYEAAGAMAFWWISDDGGKIFSNYEVVVYEELFPGEDEYDFSNYLYFDLYFDRMVTEVPVGKFKLGEELDEASFTSSDGSRESVYCVAGELEIQKTRKGYSIAFSGETSDGAMIQASYKGNVKLSEM